MFCYMTAEAEFDDIFFDLKEQIIGKGLVVEHIGHVGKMLEHTPVAVIGSYNNPERLQLAIATRISEIWTNPIHFSPKFTHS